MPNKFDEIMKYVKVGSGIAKVFVPGAAGSILDQVNKSIADPKDPNNEEALKALAKENQEQTQAILALHERLKKAGL